MRIRTKTCVHKSAKTFIISKNYPSKDITLKCIALLSAESAL
jgi:hypothetical protein